SMSAQELAVGKLNARVKAFASRFTELFEGDRGLLSSRAAELAAPQDTAGRAASDERPKAIMAAGEEIAGQIAEAVDPLEMAVRNANNGMNQATDLTSRVAEVSAAAAEVNARARSIQALTWQLLTANDVAGVDGIVTEVGRQISEVDR